MKKILLILMVLNILTFSVCAKNVKNDFESVIQDSGVDLESIAISIKNADNGKKIYLPQVESWYYYYFLKGSMHRECCYTCKYAREERVSGRSSNQVIKVY